VKKENKERPRETTGNPQEVKKKPKDLFPKVCFERKTQWNKEGK